jgi:hypothetical protein
MLPTERVPLWAAHWLVAGYDGEHLVYLAGLHGDDPHDVRDALPAALRDCGAEIPESDLAAATVVFTHLAQRHIEGMDGPNVVVGWLGHGRHHTDPQAAGWRLMGAVMVYRGSSGRPVIIVFHKLADHGSRAQF